MATRTIAITVTDEQLVKMVEGLKEIEPHYKVLDAVKLLQLLLQQEADNVGVYLDNRIDGGGNELIGDVLGEKDCVGVVEEIDA